MAKSRRLEDTLAELSRLREDPSSGASIAALREVLRGKSSHAAAKAAEIAGEHEIGELKPDLVAAFGRFSQQGERTDPGCSAKTAIAEALYRMAADEHELFLSGVRCVQMEPVWGGKVDTATALRGVSALGLVRANYREAMTVLADLLADPEARVRADAARAIAYSENTHGIPLLRLKALSGDEDATVMTECFGALLQLAPQASLPFVSGFLSRPSATTQEAAALALGGTRSAEALPILRAWWERTRESDLRRTALLAIAMLKRDEAIAWLIDLVAQSEGPTARDAIAALAIYRHDDALVERVRAAGRRKDVNLRAALSDAFEKPPRDGT